LLIPGHDTVLLRLEEAMQQIFENVRVIELAGWVFVPAAATILADQGADVIKVEHPETGDPSRGLITQGLGTASSVNLGWQQNNRGKRSIGIDVKKPEGRELVYRLVESADVFLTNFRPGALTRLELDVEQLRARNPRLIYARGHGVGVRGPEANRPCYDMTAFWARGGMAHTLSPPGMTPPVGQRPAFGDRTSAMSLAFGIASALYKRELTGEPSVIDVSLLASAMWTLASDVVYSANPDYDPHALGRRRTNPVTGSFQTSDGRWISLVFLQPDRYWDDFCRHLDRPELADDPRFSDMGVRAENSVACVTLLEEIFASRTYAEWCERFQTLDAPWAPMQSVRELRDDPQTRANGYMIPVESPDGVPFELVGAPCQFDEEPPQLRPAPEVGAHTEEVLLEMGMSWDEISDCKKQGAIL
jgi:crotonobetainyl-CoA:carnitine CoA-transferase CaiB-like acyl-CoA transferase